MKSEEEKQQSEYGDEITLSELEGHYKLHILSPEAFIELVALWHSKEIIKLNNLKS